MGHWEKIGLQWHETSVINCQLCGKIIPADIWVTEVNEETKVFCSPECEELYISYWLPKYKHGNLEKQD